MTDLPAPARYFPVSPEPLRMQAGLIKLGVDFGNAERDALFFQRDSECERYRAAKHRAERDGFAPPIERLAVVDTTPEERRAHDVITTWMRTTIGREHPGLLADDGVTEPRHVYRAVASRVQEDFAVMMRDGDADRAIALSVCFPSGWRPERLVGASFEAIHGPVPKFAKAAAVAKSMMSSMVDRGPYVRFVWTLSADDVLDHHPEEGRRAPWTDETSGFFRVERQLTVPFPDIEASLFVIRTYVYPLASLTARELDTLRQAVAAMPDEIAEYKGLLRWRSAIGHALARAAAAT